MDSEARHKLLNGVEFHFRTYFESAQEHFPAALILLSEDAKIASLREISKIKPDLLAAVRNVAREDVGDLVKNIDDDSPYPYRQIKTRHLMYRDVPDKLLVEREDLRRTGYVIMGHAQAASRHDNHGFDGHIARALMGDISFYRPSNYMAHMEHVFGNARAISEIQAAGAGFETPYDANLQEFTPGVRVTSYAPLIEKMFQHAQKAREQILRTQRAAPDPVPLPEFSKKQGQRLVDLICDLLPVADETYQTRMLVGIPSMCMGNIATIRFSSNPLTLAETTFHERTGHLSYRYNSTDSLGISGFHMDEARALSMERFFLREPAVLAQLSVLMVEAYGTHHEGFAPENLLAITSRVNPDISDRTASDDLTYILQEIIRGRTEMLVMNGELKTGDMPDYMAAETEAAFGLKDLNGYHIMRETFQWPLCMQGHLAAYPTGMVVAAQLHMAAKAELGADFSSITHGPESPYFAFMDRHVDAQGAEIEPADIIRLATGQDFLDREAYMEAISAKAQKNWHPEPESGCQKNDLTV